MAEAIELSGLSRSFALPSGTVPALRDIDLTVPEGQIVGLLGHNGAGKTTLTKILSTLLLPTAGTARIFGYDVVRDVAEVRRHTGVLFGGDQGLYPRLSGRDNVRYFAVLGGLPRRGAGRRVDRVLGDVGMLDAAGRPVTTYSKGMRQRLHIAIAMAVGPRLLLLDEPSIGLDPVEADRLRRAVRALRETGTTVVLTTHNLLDVERLADRIVLLAGGRVVSDTDVPTFARMAGHVATVHIHGTGRPPDPDRRAGAGTAEHADGSWTVTHRVTEWDSAAFAGIAHLLGGHGAGTEIRRVDVAPVRLEDVYVDVDRQGAEAGRG